MNQLKVEKSCCQFRKSQREPYWSSGPYRQFCCYCFFLHLVCINSLRSIPDEVKVRKFVCVCVRKVECRCAGILTCWKKTINFAWLLISGNVCFAFGIYLFPIFQLSCLDCIVESSTGLCYCVEYSTVVQLMS